MSVLGVALVIALALLALLVSVRLFLLRPRRPASDGRPPVASDTRSSLRDLLADPDGARGREAEGRGDWEAARAAYRRALERLRDQDPEDPGRSLKLRALQSKLEELDRRIDGGG